MRLTTLFIITLIAGCAYMPQELLKVGTKHQFKSKKNPAESARCIERNAENQAASFVAQQRPLDSTGSIEVIARHVGDAATAIAVAHVFSTTSGSDITVWVNPNILGNPGVFAAKLADQC